MSTEVLAWLSLIVLIATVFLSIKGKVNLGILAIGIGFLFGFLVLIKGGSMSSLALKGKPITALFPFNIFWMILSVSLLLNVGQVNGTFDLFIKKTMNLAGGRRALIPIYIFIAMFIMCSIGAATSGVVILLCTIAATVAKDQDIDPIFMLMSVLVGTSVSIGSPVAIIGIIVNGFSEQLWGEKIAPSYMYPYAAILSVVTFAILYILFKGWKLERWPKIKSEDIPKLNTKQWITLGGMLLFVLLALVLGFEIGLSAFLCTAILLFLRCADEKKMIALVPWNSVLLISGMCMLIGIVKEAGGMTLLTNTLSAMMNHYTVKPLYAILGSLLSMITSITSVILPTFIPTIPDIAVKTGVNPYSIVTALCYGANVTCTSPVSSMGAIALGILTSTKPNDPNWETTLLFKRQFKWAFILMGVVAVLVTIGLAG